jgi:hypothetical protein
MKSWNRGIVFTLWLAGVLTGCAHTDTRPDDLRSTRLEPPGRCGTRGRRRSWRSMRR